MLLTFLSFPLVVWCIGPYKEGDKLIVHASSGLVLRKTADTLGEKITTLPYGDEVTVQKDDQPKKLVLIEEFPGYKIRGYWAKVKSKNGEEGYVFDGYLSRYPVPGAVVADPKDGEAYSPAELYLLGVTKKKGVRVKLPKVGNQYDHYRQLFKNGAQVEFGGGEGGTGTVLVFEKGVSTEEAYLIGKSLWLKGMHVKSSNKKQKITLDSDDGQYQIVVENRAGFAVLTMNHAD